MRPKKTPPSGVFLKQSLTTTSRGGYQLLIGASTNHFDFHTTVLGTAFFGLVVSYRLLLALAFGIDPIFLDALGHQISLDRFCATDRQLLVVSIAADRVGMTHGNDNFQVDALDSANQIVQFGFA